MELCVLVLHLGKVVPLLCSLRVLSIVEYIAQLGGCRARVGTYGKCLEMSLYMVEKRLLDRAEQHMGHWKKCWVLWQPKKNKESLCSCQLEASLGTLSLGIAHLEEQASSSHLCS